MRIKVLMSVNANISPPSTGASMSAVESITLLSELMDMSFSSATRFGFAASNAIPKNVVNTVVINVLMYIIG